MNKNPKYRPTEKTAGKKIVEQIDDALKAFRKLSDEKQGELPIDLYMASREIRKKQVSAIVQEILDVMHIELYGYSKLHNFQTIKYKRRIAQSKAVSDDPAKSENSGLGLRLVAKNDKPQISSDCFRNVHNLFVINGGRSEK